MAAAIAKLQTQVAMLQRDLLATETGVLQRIEGSKHIAERRLIETKDEVPH